MRISEQSPFRTKWSPGSIKKRLFSPLCQNSTLTWRVLSPQNSSLSSTATSILNWLLSEESRTLLVRISSRFLTSLLYFYQILQKNLRYSNGKSRDLRRQRLHNNLGWPCHGHWCRCIRSVKLYSSLLRPEPPGHWLRFQSRRNRRFELSFWRPNLAHDRSWLCSWRDCSDPPKRTTRASSIPVWELPVPRRNFWRRGENRHDSKLLTT